MFNSSWGSWWRKLYTMSYLVNNQAPLYFRWMEAFLNCYKVWEYDGQDCSSGCFSAKLISSKFFPKFYSWISRKILLSWPVVAAIQETILTFCITPNLIINFWVKMVNIWYFFKILWAFFVTLVFANFFDVQKSGRIICFLELNLINN